jgi:hypothetical protein
MVVGLVTRQYGLNIVAAIFLAGLVLIKFIETKLPNKKRILVRNLLILVLLGWDIAFGFLARGTLPLPKGSQVWAMHEITNPGYLIPNGLSPFDVNGDGFEDYLTNFEWDGYLRIAFHPSDVTKIRNPWEAITIGHIDNAESCALGDFDADGNADAVVAHGMEMGAQSGVFIIWGPDQSQVMNPSAWIQTPDIPGTIGQGHFHCVEGVDINGDGLMDIIVGGRGTSPKAGLKWIEAPALPDQRRNLSAWQIHEIDPDLESGHGFIFSDLDLDGHPDIIIANSDWDTTPDQQKIIVYKNPGVGTPEQRSPWPKYVIYQQPDFYSKEQVAAGDFNADSYPEIAVHMENHIYIFENPQTIDGNWVLHKIAKPEMTQSRARTIALGDFNNDGRMDILGMLIHRDGYLPSSKAAVFWMNFTSDPFTGEWETHVIKWADGFFGFGKWNGEKWDQALLRDMDNDGDFDIVANCEEYHSLGFAFIAVVWFENPIIA